jgi:threonine/homoserine/homoserine lactone efflux protein
MAMFLQGILLGLSLSFLIGPLLFALLQAALTGGMRAGVSLAAGTWVSDVLFVALIFHGLGWLGAIASRPDFRLWSGVAGGTLLLVFGAASLWKQVRMPMTGQATKPSARSVGAWFLRGFLLNSINPFTVFFWLGLAAAFVVPNVSAAPERIYPFFTGMFLMLIGADLAKAYLAQRISRWLSPKNLVRVKTAVGISLLIFGLVIMGQALAGQ